MSKEPLTLSPDEATQLVHCAALAAMLRAIMTAADAGDANMIRRVLRDAIAVTKSQDMQVMQRAAEKLVPYAFCEDPDCNCCRREEFLNRSRS